MRGGIRLGVVAVVAALIVLAAQGSAPAQQFPGVFTVDTTADGDDRECARDCTLREAVSLASTAQGGGTASISLPAGVYRLTRGPLVIRNNLLILGAGLVGGQGAGARTTIIDAGNRSRVVEVSAEITAILAGVTLTGGRAATGGAGLVAAGGQLQFYNSVVEGNTATTRGGGILSLGIVGVANSTVTGNRVISGSGGGIAVQADGDGVLTSSTVTGNTAATGGGITSAGNLAIQNSTIAGGLFQESADGAGISMWNTILSGGTGAACGGSIAGIPRGTFSRNLADDASCQLTGTEGVQNVDPRLGALRNNGGPTDTRALGAGSPAINAGDTNLCGSPDQRGATPVGVCDIGAFEFGGRPPEPQLPPPVPGETVNVTLSRGTVLIKLPGSNEFFELQDGQQLPVGSTLDTTKGRVNLVAAANATGKTQKSWFYEGVFKVLQTKGRKPLTTLAMTGKLSCGSGNASAAAKKKKRRLWGNGKGRFRTKGKHSAATVLGTKWLVEDRCNGTLTRVKRGTVVVTQFKPRRTIRIKGPNGKYFAKR
jgi:CSLREA domain-containing protein